MLDIGTEEARKLPRLEEPRPLAYAQLETGPSPNPCSSWLFLAVNVTMRTLQAGALYFTIVFCAGFVLGTLRTLWVAPRIGNRAAELAEAPFMLVFTVIAARWAIRFLAMPVTLSDRLVMGCLALALMLIAEFALALWLRRMSPSEYIASRDPISGLVYCALLVGFAIMPALLK